MTEASTALRTTVALLLAAAGLSTGCAPQLDELGPAERPPETQETDTQSRPSGVTFDGLEAVPGSRFAHTYLDPSIDFRSYDSILLLDAYVAFDNRWVRDQRLRRRDRISQRDLDRIREDLARLFRQVFTEELQGAGVRLVREPGETVLILRPAILDLFINAPDLMQPGRTSSFTHEAGRMTLFLELFDSFSGDIVARAADTRRARWSTQLEIANRVTNTAEARRMLRRWARILAEAFREIHAYQPPE